MILRTDFDSIEEARTLILEFYDGTIIPSDDTGLEITNLRELRLDISRYKKDISTNLANGKSTSPELDSLNSILNLITKDIQEAFDPRAMIHKATLVATINSKKTSLQELKKKDPKETSIYHIYEEAISILSVAIPKLERLLEILDK